MSEINVKFKCEKFPRKIFMANGEMKQFKDGEFTAKTEAEYKEAKKLKHVKEVKAEEAKTEPAKGEVPEITLENLEEQDEAAVKAWLDVKEVPYVHNTGLPKLKEKIKKILEGETE